MTAPNADERRGLSEVEVQFIEGMGILAQADGLPRIAGRLMGLLVLEGGPLAFGELANRLEVSRGSISSNARLLEGMGILERIARPGERGDFFQLAPDPYARLLDGIKERSAKGCRLARDTRDALAATASPDDAALHRLAELADFYAALRRSVEEMREHLT